MADVVCRHFQVPCRRVRQRSIARARGQGHGPSEISLGLRPAGIFSGVAADPDPPAPNLQADVAFGLPLHFRRFVISGLPLAYDRRSDSGHRMAIASRHRRPVPDMPASLRATAGFRQISNCISFLVRSYGFLILYDVFSCLSTSQYQKSPVRHRKTDICSFQMPGILLLISVVHPYLLDF